MFEFAHPWAFALLPLPLLVFRLVPPYREAVTAIRVPFFERLAEASGEQAREGSVILSRRAFQMIVAVAVWLLLVAAVANPQWAGAPVEKIEAARDIMLAIDISGSMDKRDFASEDSGELRRIDAVKQVVSNFIAARDGDRIGLIVFGTKAYVQAPFTQDLETAAALLNGIEVGMAGPHTALGDAIGLAIRTFDASKVEQRLLIVLTDGSDTGSRMTPLNASEIAAQNGVGIFSIGVGDPEAEGEDKADFKTLEQIADRAGGQFFSARDRDGLRAVYTKIDRLTPREVRTLSYRPRRSLVHWPAGAAVLLGLIAYVALFGMVRLRRAA